jgi:hypothetical protein
MHLDHPDTASTLLLREQYKQADKLTFNWAGIKLIRAGDNPINDQCCVGKKPAGLRQGLSPKQWDKSVNHFALINEAC